MSLYLHLDQLPASLRGGAVAIGNFDGVHLGHRRIVQRLLHCAQRCDRPSLIFTFDPHPTTLLRPDAVPPPLTTTARKAELLAEMGVAGVLAYPTDQALLQLTAQQFFETIVVRRLAACCLVEGPNFFFGHNREGDIALLRELCQARKLALEIVEPLPQSPSNDSLVSSSRIRRLICDGQVEQARALLGRPHRVEGNVVEGARRGRQLGFPTANLDQPATVAPGHGVYAGAAQIAAGLWRPAAIHIGPNPTFQEAWPKLEVHVLDFEGDLYGRPLAVDFYVRLREIQRFSGTDALRLQLAADVENARRAFALTQTSPSASELDS